MKLRLMIAAVLLLAKSYAWYASSKIASCSGRGPITIGLLLLRNVPMVDPERYNKHKNYVMRNGRPVSKGWQVHYVRVFSKLKNDTLPKDYSYATGLN